MRIGVRFSRNGMSRFVSHLDMQRFFSRAIRRSGIEVQYSQGFNPHIIMSFAQALAVGLETKGDYLEFNTVNDEDISSVRERLSLQMSSGIDIITAGMLDPKGKKLMACVEAASYSVYCSDDIKERFAALTEGGSYIIKNKKGHDVDAGQMILSSDIMADRIDLMLVLSSKMSLSPFSLFDAVAPGESVRIVRNDLYTGSGTDIISLSGLFL